MTVLLLGKWIKERKKEIAEFNLSFVFFLFQGYKPKIHLKTKLFLLVLLKLVY